MKSFLEINFLENKPIPFFKLRGGCIVTVILHPKEYNTQIRILSSKKDIMQKLHSKQQFKKTRLGADASLITKIYGLVGVCLFFKNSFENSAVCLRNVLQRFPFEAHYPCFGSISIAFVVHKEQKRKYKRRRVFYLLRKKAKFSSWQFDFVIQDLTESVF